MSASRLKEVASLLIDIHGQHEHQSLLSKKKHLEILDAYAKDALGEKKERLAACYQEYRKLKKEWESSSLDTEERARELSFLAYEVKEIEEAQLSVGRIPGWKNSIADLQTQKRSWMPYRLRCSYRGRRRYRRECIGTYQPCCGKSVRFRHMRSALRRWNRCLPILIIC